MHVGCERVAGASWVVGKRVQGGTTTWRPISGGLRRLRGTEPTLHLNEDTLVFRTARLFRRSGADDDVWHADRLVVGVLGRAVILATARRGKVNGEKRKSGGDCCSCPSCHIN